MKTRLLVALIVTIISITCNAWAFNRNLTGAWVTPSGEQWVIAQISDSANFSTTSYDEEVGQVTFEFTGYVSGRSGEDDTFDYSGVGSPKNVRISGRMCTIRSNMAAGGYVSGEIGGRVIHMQYCAVRFSTKCEGRDDSIDGTVRCNGTWK